MPDKQPPIKLRELHEAQTFRFRERRQCTSWTLDWQELLSETTFFNNLSSHWKSWTLRGKLTASTCRLGKKTKTDITWKLKTAWKMHKLGLKICQTRQVQLSKRTRDSKKIDVCRVAVVERPNNELIAQIQSGRQCEFVFSELLQMGPNGSFFQYNIGRNCKTTTEGKL